MKVEEYYKMERHIGSSVFSTLLGIMVVFSFIFIGLHLIFGVMQFNNDFLRKSTILFGGIYCFWVFIYLIMRKYESD